MKKNIEFDKLLNLLKKNAKLVKLLYIIKIYFYDKFAVLESFKIQLIYNHQLWKN